MTCMAQPARQSCGLALNLASKLAGQPTNAQLPVARHSGVVVALIRMPDILQLTRPKGGKNPSATWAIHPKSRLESHSETVLRFERESQSEFDSESESVPSPSRCWLDIWLICGVRRAGGQEPGDSPDERMGCNACLLSLGWSLVVHRRLLAARPREH